MNKQVRKVLSIISYIIMAFFIFMLVKTELRKWLIMEGEATPANTVIFWVSLGLSALFGYLGLVISPVDDKPKEPKIIS